MSGREEFFLDAALAFAEDAAPPEPALVGRLENLPKWLNLVPMVAQWLWLSLRHGSWTLPAAANPAITAGGLVGEGKAEYFRIMGPLARARTASFAVLRNGRDALP